MYPVDPVQEEEGGPHLKNYIFDKDSKIVVI